MHVSIRQHGGFLDNRRRGESFERVFTEAAGGDWEQDAFRELFER
jgi:hypothetical protein